MSNPEPTLPPPPPPEPKSEPEPEPERKPEPKPEPRPEPTTAEDDPYVDCDVCDARIHRDKLGRHQYVAHQVDRRKQEPSTAPPPPKREKKQGTQEPQGDGKTSPRQRGWFSGRPQS